MSSLQTKLDRNADRLLSLVPGGSGEPAPGAEDFKKEIQDLGGGSMIEDESVEESERSDVADLDKDAGGKSERGDDTETPASSGVPHPLGGSKMRD